MKRFFTLSLAALAALAILGALWWSARPVPAPASTFVLTDGQTLGSQSLQGKVTLLNFWATSCSSCVQEMPMLVATWHKYHDKGYQTIAVAMQNDPVPYVLNFVATRKLPFPVALDHNAALARDWGNVALTPTSFLVDKQGRIVQQYIGPIDESALHALIERLLAQ